MSDRLEEARKMIATAVSNGVSIFAYTQELRARDIPVPFLNDKECALLVIESTFSIMNITTSFQRRTKELLTLAE